MADTSIFWLRVAAVLYAMGLLHSMLAILKRRNDFYGFAVGTFRVGVVLQGVAIVELAMAEGRLPVENFYGTINLCAFLIALAFLFVDWRYHFASTSIALFPLVFLMTLVAGMRQPAPTWSDVRVRDAWLIVHIVLVLVGYAALLLTAVSSIFYLIQERRLKSKKSPSLLEKLPPLGTLDDLISTFDGLRLRLHYAGRDLRSAVGLHRTGHQLGGERQHLALVRDLGIVPGDDLHACVGGLARAQGRVDGAGGAGLRRADLGGACRTEADADPMKLLITGLSHHTAPVEVREKLAFEEQSLPGALDRLCHRPGMVEGMILSTCNRVEVAVTAEESSDAANSVDEFLAEARSVEPSWVSPYLYHYNGPDAIRHLFRVASSLDSMIVGEPQILGQLKSAYMLAKEHGSVSGFLDLVMTRAFNVAKRVRTETEIGSSAVSVSYAAVELARDIFGSLSGKRVLLVGAGKMAESAARHLRRAGVSDILVTNRTRSRADALAEEFHGRVVEYDEIAAYAAGRGYCHRVQRCAAFYPYQRADARRDQPPPPPADVSDRHRRAAQRRAHREHAGRDLRLRYRRPGSCRQK